MDKKNTVALTNVNNTLFLVKIHKNLSLVFISMKKYIGKA
jgi:hypothetical protein